MNASPPLGLVEAPPLLEVTGLRKAYGDGGFFSRRRHHALDDVSLTLRASDGRVLSIVGESGSGKTTLARVILRLVTADAGDVWVEGHPIVSRGNPVVDQRTLRHLVQPIFQNPFETFSLHLPVDSYLFRTAANLQSAHTRTDLESAVSEALVAVGLTYSKVAGRGIRAFSGGELQRIAIARALIAKPRLIVADEPVSMVDASLRTTIVNLFKELASKLDVAFVYITHDLSTAYYLSDLMAIMKSGKLVDFGRPDAIIDNPNADYTRALIDAIPTLGRKWAI